MAALGFRRGTRGLSSLACKYLPEFQFQERHCLDIRGTSAEVMEQAVAYRPERSDSLFRLALSLRELPQKIFGGTSKAFGFADFFPLERCGDKELAFGLIGQFWRADYGLQKVQNGMEYLEFSDPAFCKLVLVWSVEEKSPGLVTLVTETRVHCPTDETRAKFAPYWYLIRPVSGLIRMRMLRIVRAAVEQSRSTPR